MTKKQFIERAIRRAEKDIGAPPGWWGTWRDLTNGKARIRFSTHSMKWVLSDGSGHIVSKHFSRGSAIAKARRIQ